MPSLTGCPGRQELERLLHGQVLDPAAETLEEHLLTCPQCVATMRTLSDDTTLAEALRHEADTAEVPQDAEVEALARRVRDALWEAMSPAGESSTLGQLRPSVLPADLLRCLAPPEAPDEIGRLGSYRILEVLGAGGMGVVLRAVDAQLQRHVALKVMRPALAEDPVCRERFLREARATAAIEHDHVVPIFQVGEDRGIPYLAMPLLRGETLADRLEREGRLPLAEVLRIGRETAAGLAAAHARGLIHRDIKPANLWLEASDQADAGRSPSRVKLLDFGLAQTVKADVRLTGPGHVLGTPSYMAPEQTRGGNVDPRSDLYSLGVVLYELCSGRLPFPQRDMLALLAALSVDAPRPLRRLEPALPPDLAALVMRLLAKQPYERPASAQAVVEALEKLERDQQRPPASRRWRPIAAALLLAGLLGYVAGPAVYRIVTNQGELVITTEDPDVEVVIRQGGRKVDIIDLKTKQQVHLTAGEYEVELADGDAKLRLSADRFTLSRGGQQIVAVVRVPPAAPPAPAPPPPGPTLGRGRALVGHSQAVTSVACSGDGSRAVSGSRDGTVRLWDVAAGKQLASLGSTAHAIHCVALSPEGKRVAANDADTGVQLWDADTGKELRTLKGHEGPVTGLAFAADGKRLVSSSLDGSVRIWLLGNGRQVGHLVGGMGPVEGLALSTDARLVLCGSQDHSAHLWGLDEKPLHRLAGHSGPVVSVALSPDGRLALTASADPLVRLWDVESGALRQRLPHPEPVACAAFTPDSRRVVSGCRDGTVRVWDALPGKEVARWPGHAGGVRCLAVSPDGRQVLSGGNDSEVKVWDLPTRE